MILYGTIFVKKNIFKLDYFGKQVFLAQSPQFYKQAMVGVFDRFLKLHRFIELKSIILQGI